MCSSMISIAIIDNEKEDVSGGQSLKARLVTMARKALQVESSNETSGKFARKKYMMGWIICSFYINYLAFCAAVKSSTISDAKKQNNFFPIMNDIYVINCWVWF